MHGARRTSVHGARYDNFPFPCTLRPKTPFPVHVVKHGPPRRGGSFWAELMFQKIAVQGKVTQTVSTDNVCRERCAEAGSRTEVRPFSSLAFYTRIFSSVVLQLGPTGSRIFCCWARFGPFRRLPNAAEQIRQRSKPLISKWLGARQK